MNGRAITCRALPGVPDIEPGADLAGLVHDGMQRAGISLEAGDVLVVAQKAVSKAEDRFVDLRTIEPSTAAIEVAGRANKDPRFVEVVLRESSSVIRVARNVLITRHRRGFVMANAGIDQSNVGRGEHTVLLLPVDPDASAAALRCAIAARCSVAPGVIISDSFGRAWRLGVVNIALGVAGFPAIVDLRGHPDRDGWVLQVTQVAVADAIAAAAGLVMGEAADGTPIVLVRGVGVSAPDGSGQALIRPEAEDLFR